MLTTKQTTYSRLLKNKIFAQRLCGRFKSSSAQTQPAVQPSENYEKQLKDFQTLTNITKKIKPKKPQRAPFAKSLFLGIFDTEILTYPQLEKEDLQNLEKDISQVNKLVKQEHMKDFDSFNKSFRQNLADYKAIGLQASQFAEGRQCMVTESLRFLEAMSDHPLRDSIITSEQLGVQCFVKFAGDKVNEIYLRRVMSGESLPAFCLAENDSIDFKSFKSKAKLSENQKDWVLNGEKSWVINGATADILIVFAVTDVVHRDNLTESKITAFVVDKSTPGVTVHQNDALGIETAHITFNDVTVPSENIIGKVNHGDKLLRPLLVEYQLSLGVSSIALTKKLYNNLNKTILAKSTDSNMLYQTDAIAQKTSQLATNLYAMESMCYLTSGLIDNYENQDIELESALVKVFSAQACLDASLTCLDLVGAEGSAPSHWAYKCHREALRSMILHGSNDSLEILLSLLGLQFAGKQLNETINKIRNPLFHGSFSLKRLFTDRRNAEDNPKLNLFLIEYVHPSLGNAAKYLEYSVKRLEFAVEILLVRHGPEVLRAHMELRRLARVIIDVYAMTACVGRASRSYCIGLQHADYEMLVANTFCNYGAVRVKANVKKILEGEYQTNDVNYRAIAKRGFKFKEYYFKHPLCRNF